MHATEVFEQMISIALIVNRNVCQPTSMRISRLMGARSLDLW